MGGNGWDGYFPAGLWAKFHSRDLRIRSYSIDTEIQWQLPCSRLWMNQFVEAQNLTHTIRRLVSLLRDLPSSLSKAGMDTGKEREFCFHVVRVLPVLYLCVKLSDFTFCLEMAALGRLVLECCLCCRNSSVFSLKKILNMHKSRKNHMSEPLCVHPIASTIFNSWLILLHPHAPTHPHFLLIILK